MLMRLDWQEPRPEPPARRTPSRWLVVLFWTCILFCVVTQLLFFWPA